MQISPFQIVCGLLLAISSASAQVPVQDAEGQPRLAFPAPDFLPDRPYAVLRMGAPSRLLRRSVVLLARLGNPADMAQAMGTVGSLSGGQMPLSGVSWHLPSWLVIDEPARFTPDFLLAQRGLAGLFEARGSKSFLVLPIGNEAPFLAALNARYGDAEVLDSHHFSWRPPTESIDYDALAGQLLAGDDAGIELPATAGLQVWLQGGFAIMSRHAASLERARELPQPQRWIALQETPRPSNESLDTVTFETDRRAPFPDADIVLDLDIGRLRDHRKVDLDRQISLIRPRSSAWALPFLDDFHRMERVVYAVSFLSQGLRLQVVIEASPGSGGLPALQDHDPLRASALTERLGATSKIASSIDRWELTVELPVDGLVKLMNWLQEAPAPPAIRTQLRLVAFAKRLREVGEAALTIPSLDGWGRPIQHLPTPRGMKLFSLGADGRPGGDDDDRDFELIVDH